MKSIIYNIGLAALLSVAVSACQDKDYDIAAPVIAPIDENTLTGALDGYDYTWSWPSNVAYGMMVSVYDGNTLIISETVRGNSFVHRGVDSNIDYTYVFKLTDGSNISSGVVKHYMRPGASKMSGLSMSQIDKGTGYDVEVSWDVNDTATEVLFVATNGMGREISETLPAASDRYTISDVGYGEEWTATLTASNPQGLSLPVSTTLKIGKTAVGFLSIYETPEELLQNGDDDEASAWLWLRENYPTAQYVYFGDIKSVADVDPFRVLFWMRDLEGVDESAVFAMPKDVEDATPYIRQWYADGGNMLLWSHATVYVGAVGRLDMDLLKNNEHTIGTDVGGFNADAWSMAVSLNPGGKFTKDHSDHPIYRGLQIGSNDRCNLIAFKGAGWTEDHNCLFFNIPSALTGLSNQDEECYNMLTNTYGIYPLGTWDSQIDYISQLNVWEARQGNTEFKGTILCIGNGGCEFSMKNADGTPDISAHPSNNPYQENVLTLARNAIEYLKSR